MLRDVLSPFLRYAAVHVCPVMMCMRCRMRTTSRPIRSRSNRSSFAMWCSTTRQSPTSPSCVVHPSSTAMRSLTLNLAPHLQWEGFGRDFAQHQGKAEGRARGRVGQWQVDDRAASRALLRSDPRLDLRQRRSPPLNSRRVSLAHTGARTLARSNSRTHRPPRRPGMHAQTHSTTRRETHAGPACTFILFWCGRNRTAVPLVFIERCGDAEPATIAVARLPGCARVRRGISSSTDPQLS